MSLCRPGRIAPGLSLPGALLAAGIAAASQRPFPPGMPPPGGPAPGSPAVTVPLGTTVTAVCNDPGRPGGYRVVRLGAGGLEAGTWRPEKPFRPDRRVPLRPDEAALLRAVLRGAVDRLTDGRFRSRGCRTFVPAPARHWQCTMQAGPAAAFPWREGCSGHVLVENGLLPGLGSAGDGASVPFLGGDAWARSDVGCAVERLRFVPDGAAPAGAGVVRGTVLRWWRVRGGDWRPAGAGAFTLVADVLLLQGIVRVGPSVAVLSTSKTTVILEWFAPGGGVRPRHTGLGRCGPSGALPAHPAAGRPASGPVYVPLPPRETGRRTLPVVRCHGGLAGRGGVDWSPTPTGRLGLGLPPAEAREAGVRLLRVLTDLHAWGLTERRCRRRSRAPSGPRPPDPMRPDGAIVCERSGLLQDFTPPRRPDEDTCGVGAGARLWAVLESAGSHRLPAPELTGRLWVREDAREGCGEAGVRFVPAGRAGPDRRHGVVERVLPGGGRAPAGRWWQVGARWGVHVLVTETDPDLPPAVRLVRWGRDGRQPRLEPVYPPHHPPPALVPCAGDGKAAGQGAKRTRTTTGPAGSSPS